MLYPSLILGAALAVALIAALPSEAAAPKTKKHILVVTVTKGFRHDSIPVAEKTIEDLGNAGGGWDTDFVRTDEEMAVKMTPAALLKYDCVIFANTTGTLPLPDPQGFLDYVKAGHGFCAMHAGGDTFHQWPNGTAPISLYVDMLGGEFRGHHNQCAVDGDLRDPAHPSTKPLIAAGKTTPAPTVTDIQQIPGIHEHSVVSGKKWYIFDEIYLFKNNDPAKFHSIVGMDHHPEDGSNEEPRTGDFELTWCKSYGKGRIFYTALGHRQEVWRDPLYQQHIQGGIEFALGLAKGGMLPNPEVIPVPHLVGAK